MTTASRLVLAPVCLIASWSSFSGISTVVFMPPILSFRESIARPVGIPARSARQRRHAQQADRHQRGADPEEGSFQVSERWQVGEHGGQLVHEDLDPDD